MNLAEMRRYEGRAVKYRIHTSFPCEVVTPVHTTHSSTVDQTIVSNYCQIGPTANHGVCQATWCRCPCHDEHENYWGV